MKARILATPGEKAQGVIGRENLEPDEIYIFMQIYPQQGFHMRNVQFPLDIAFLDQNCSILDIQPMEPQVGTAYAPDRTNYAVETCKDYFTNNNIRIGDFWKEVYNKIS